MYKVNDIIKHGPKLAVIKDITDITYKNGDPIIMHVQYLGQTATDYIELPDNTVSNIMDQPKEQMLSMVGELEKFVGAYEKTLTEAGGLKAYHELAGILMRLGAILQQTRKNIEIVNWDKEK